jgi:LPXTG-motif cell wall-anchored protein
MSFAPRRRAVRAFAALAALVVLMVPLAVAGTALASTSTITQQDCDQGTIKDKAGQAISKSRCESLIGKQVALAGTGFEVWILAAAGVACLGGAAYFGVRRTRPVRAV